MRKLHWIPVIVTVFALVFSVAMAKDKSTRNVVLSSSSDMGSYLVDARGMTLYYFTKDTPGKSACSGACVKNWPLFYVEKVKPGKGLKSRDFGTITREDGKKQTTFRGYPLYYFVKDAKAGDTTGQGVKNVWYVIDPSNFPPAM
jgi:predicted lipoprotein with Yx(FWY)xxD motif